MTAQPEDNGTADMTPEEERTEYLAAFYPDGDVIDLRDKISATKKGIQSATESGWPDNAEKLETQKQDLEQQLKDLLSERKMHGLSVVPESAPKPTPQAATLADVALEAKAAAFPQALPLVPVVASVSYETTPAHKPVTVAQTEAPIVAVQAAPMGVDSDGIAKISAAVNRGWEMKKAALIKKHEHQWLTIRRDFQDASENGLSRAAKAPGHGDWFEAAALDWARQRGKLTEETGQPTPSPATPFSGLTHRILR